MKTPMTVPRVAGIPNAMAMMSDMSNPLPGLFAT
jgi:hypothetical protein